MTIESTLFERANDQCELCGSNTHLAVFVVPPERSNDADSAALLCSVCREQIEQPEQMDPNHWRCLNDSMWSQIPAVQVLAWRMLQRLRGEGWPQDLLDMLYLEDDVLAWAEEDTVTDDSQGGAPTLDANGAPLQAGDTVTLVKDLDVKGAGFTAKRGTAVRNIALTDNPEQIEGRVNGVRIVLLTRYLKKGK